MIWCNSLDKMTECRGRGTVVVYKVTSLSPMSGPESGWALGSVGRRDRQELLYPFPRWGLRRSSLLCTASRGRSEMPALYVFCEHDVASSLGLTSGLVGREGLQGPLEKLGKVCPSLPQSSALTEPLQVEVNYC